MTARSLSRLEFLYALAVCAYPRSFREAHAAAMRQVFRDALADNDFPRLRFLLIALRDFATSLLKEHLAMMRDTLTRPALAFNALVLAGIATVLALFLYAIPQQVLRQGANDPQLQLAGDLAGKLEDGATPAEAVPATKVDMARSLAPFVNLYDDQGHPLLSQGVLNGATPAPPKGVFDYLRSHAEDRVTWQMWNGPHRVRIAAVVLRVQRVGDSGPGFVLAGRSLVQVEAREEQVRQMAALAWIAMLGMILLGAIGFGWWTRKAA